jgi:hypothetical protein
MSHTPGPWTVEWSDEEGNDGVTIEAPDGPVAFRVLEVDARLIAAAPDLLAALIRMYEQFGTQNYTKSAADAVIMAEAAIKKATGGE